MVVKNNKHPTQQMFMKEINIQLSNILWQNGSCKGENSKNEAESALRRLNTVRSKEPQPSLLVLQRKVDELKKEIVNFGKRFWKTI